MKVLVIGSGGREHALCWKIAKSPLVDTVFCAPGNGGIEIDAECVNIGVSDFASLIKFVRSNDIGLTVVGPEVPLSEGIVDVFAAEGLKIFGPDRKAAQLEGSKVFSKEAMKEFCIPTAQFCTFNDYDSAKDYVGKACFDLVVKADGLAAGKGVIVTCDKDEAFRALDEVMLDKAYGSAGNSVVLEEKLIGEEASFIAICDGENIVPLASSQDHKPVFDNDEGPNTGGMGAYSPAPVVDDKIFGNVMENVLYPLVRGLKKKGIIYKGVIYAGLMITDKGVYVLEYNVRMGDPETQPLLMRLKSDIVPVMLEVASGGSIKDMSLEWENGATVCVVMASGGYPGGYKKGLPISGIEKADSIPGVKVFHAGTKKEGNVIITSGGRVLGVTALGPDIKSAIDKAYRATGLINFDGMHYRKDIGRKALIRE
ncbi:MAG TPA: phosphoribosylamine--glycine ligase [Desulfomonilia bacterium]